MAGAMGWPLLWAVRLATEVQLKAKSEVRKLEEEASFEKDVWGSVTLLAFGLVERWESRISSNTQHAV